MITEAELAEMRATVEAEALPDTGLIERAVETKDGKGGRTQAFATVATVPCRIDPADDKTVELFGGKIGNRTAYTGFVPASTDVREGDRMTVDGQVYSVIAAPYGSWKIIQRVALAR